MAEVGIVPQGEKTLATVSISHRSRARVLAVDDEPPACKLLFTMLSQAGFSCATVHSGEEALAALQSERFDAVISDLGMPGMGGMELLAEVRRRDSYLAFLVTTGVDDVEVGVKAMRSGADDYLVKPLLGNVVLASLERSLHKRELERQVENYRQHLEQMVAERTEQLRAALEHTERSYEDTLRALGAAIDLRDSDTAGHSQRVCRYSLEIARATGLSEEQLRNLARGAYLHDIGKLGVTDAILLKPGALTECERKAMERHAQIGYDLVRGIPFLADVAEIILSHHERFDGTGYPRGLRAKEILPSARIFAVADAFDAITSDRPYRRAASFAEGREAIRRQSGLQFDPQVVEAFLSIPAEIWPAIASDQRQSASSPYFLLGLDSSVIP
jgi:cyclic di-GMP phosphodiesterase